MRTAVTSTVSSVYVFYRCSYLRGVYIAAYTCMFSLTTYVLILPRKNNTDSNNAKRHRQPVTLSVINAFNAVTRDRFHKHSPLLFLYAVLRC